MIFLKLIDFINYTQLSLDIENKIFNNITNIDKFILQDNSNYKFYFEYIDPWFRNLLNNYHTLYFPLCRTDIEIFKNIVEVNYQVNYDISYFSFSNY